MATPLQDIYDSFLSKVTDYSFIKLNKDGLLEDVLFNHLISSIVRFYSSTKDLSIDMVNKTLLVDLDIDEKEILSTGMLLSYVSGKITTSKNTEQVLSTSDIKMYSQSNQLSQLLSLKKNIQSEISQLMTIYSLKDGLKGLL